MRRTYRQHWTAHVQALAIAVLVPAVMFGLAGVTGYFLTWCILFVPVGVVMARPRVVTDESGLSVTQIVGRRRHYRWDQVDAVTTWPGGRIGREVVPASVIIKLKGRSGLDAIEELPWLPAEDKSRGWRWLVSARRQHSLAVCAALQADFQQARQSQDPVA